MQKFLLGGMLFLLSLSTLANNFIPEYTINGTSRTYTDGSNTLVLDSSVNGNSTTLTATLNGSQSSQTMHLIENDVLKLISITDVGGADLELTYESFPLTGVQLNTTYTSTGEGSVEVVGAVTTITTTSETIFTGLEQVTVPAGTFTALKGIQTVTTRTVVSVFGAPVSDTTSVATSTTWYANGIGFVKQVDSENVTWELTAYTVPGNPSTATPDVSGTFDLYNGDGGGDDGGGDDGGGNDGSGIASTDSMGCYVPDVNNDGLGEYLFHNEVTGELLLILSNNTKITLPSITGFYIAGISDFNQDGIPDICWRNYTNGLNAIWFMNNTGNIAAGEFFLSVTETTFDIVGTGDFNGDGLSEVLWRDSATGLNAIWYMSGSTVSSGDFLPTIDDPDFEIICVADFNNDGNDDILWRHQTNGLTAIWFMNGSEIISGEFIPTVANNWKIVGCGDFNADGYDDILWRETTTGENAIWLMNGANVAQGDFIPTVSAEWYVTSVGDINADGRADIIWKNTSDGSNSIWYMNGFDVSASGPITEP